jgi:hypothetical protein
MHRQGVRLDAATPLIQALVEEGIGRAGCATVEEKPAGNPNASLLHHRSGDR